MFLGQLNKSLIKHGNITLFSRILLKLNRLNLAVIIQMVLMMLMILTQS